MELPAKMSQRQTGRIIQRRASDLMMRGVKQAELEANIEKIRAGAGEQANAELKSFFILDKIAAEQNLEVDDAEINGQVAMIAAQMGERPEKLKQRFSKDGTLMNMYLKLRENKAIDQILKDAKVEEVEVKDEEKKA
jgi:trigger factor